MMEVPSLWIPVSVYISVVKSYFGMVIAVELYWEEHAAVVSFINV